MDKQAVDTKQRFRFRGAGVGLNEIGLIPCRIKQRLNGRHILDNFIVSGEQIMGHGQTAADGIRPQVCGQRLQQRRDATSGHADFQFVAPAQLRKARAKGRHAHAPLGVTLNAHIFTRRGQLLCQQPADCLIAQIIAVPHAADFQRFLQLAPGFVRQLQALLFTKRLEEIPFHLAACLVIQNAKQAVAAFEPNHSCQLRGRHAGFLQHAAHCGGKSFMFFHQKHHLIM